MQRFLQSAAMPLRMPHQKHMAFQGRPKSQGRLMHQHIALVQQHDVIALLGFIEIGGTHQHGDILAAQQFDDAPELTPRNGIDPDSRLIEQ